MSIGESITKISYFDKHLRIFSCNNGLLYAMEHGTVQHQGHNCSRGRWLSIVTYAALQEQMSPQILRYVRETWSSRPDVDLYNPSILLPRPVSMISTPEVTPFSC